MDTLKVEIIAVFMFVSAEENGEPLDPNNIKSGISKPIPR